MAQTLAGRTAFVSGSSSGIGRAVAIELARLGATVLVHGRDKSRINDVANVIRDAGGTAHETWGELTNDASAADVIRRVKDAVDGVDILINTAGNAGTENWKQSTSAVFSEQYEINANSAVRLIQGFLPEMRKRRWGRIVQFSSIAANRPLEDQVPAYCAAKAALLAITSNLAMTVATEGVTVNSVSPGYILTPALQDYFLAMPQNAGRQWSDLEPSIAEMLGIRMGRLGRPEDIAQFIGFLAGPGGDWITGSNFRLDGGNLCTMN